MIIDKQFMGDRNPFENLRVSYRGIPYVITPNAIGIMCAYILVPKGHKYDGVDYSDIKEDVVPGGLTFSGRREGFPTEELTSRADAWWLGWDYGHTHDFMRPNGVTYTEIEQDCKHAIDVLIFEEKEGEK